MIVFPVILLLFRKKCNRNGCCILFPPFFSFLRDTKSLRFNIFCVSKSGVCSFVFVGLSEPLSFNTSICLIVSKMICMVPSVLCLLVRLYEFGWLLFVIVVDFFPGSVKLRLTYEKKWFGIQPNWRASAFKSIFSFVY